MKASNEELLIQYHFDAPIAMVFEAWTNPEHLKNWYAPDGCTIEFKALEIKAGGKFHSVINDPVHGECWIIGTYKEVVVPTKLVYTMELSNEDGVNVNATEAGKPEEWPPAIITTVTFEEDSDKTKVVLHQTVSEEEAKKTGAYQSWFSMFERLQRILTH